MVNTLNTSKIARLWTDRIESGDKKLSDCPEKLYNEVVALILADGYRIDDEGNVYPPNESPTQD